MESHDYVRIWDDLSEAVTMYIFIFRKIKSDRALKFECTDHNLQGYNDYLDFSTGYFVF